MSKGQIQKVMKKSMKGILVGILLISVITVNAVAQSNDKRDHHGRHGDKGRHQKHDGYKYKTHDLSARVYRITNADSLQAKKMKPFVDKASKRLETLRTEYHRKEMKVLDSLQLQLKPLLKEEQLKKLSDFKEKHNQKLK